MKALRIVIVAKAPLPGLAKTRLIPALGASGAAELARRMLLRTVDQALAAALGPVELCVTPGPFDAAWDAPSVPGAVRWSGQGEGDLGQRLARVAQRVLEAGESVLLIGTDCPALDKARLRQAARALQRADATLRPTFDGGYALLGLNRYDPSPFSGIAWSTETVARDTLARLAQLGWRTRCHGMLHDIDEPGDLRHLPKRWIASLPGNVENAV